MDKADLVADKYDFIESDSNMVQLWALNSDRAPFDDVRVRQAMDMAVDRTDAVGRHNLWSRHDS